MIQTNLTMIQMVLVLSVLGGYVVVMSDEVNLTATIPYLCSGPLKSNTTVVLDDGEHRISSGPPCDIFNGSSIFFDNGVFDEKHDREMEQCYDSYQYKRLP